MVTCWEVLRVLRVVTTDHVVKELPLETEKESIGYFVGRSGKAVETVFDISVVVGREGGWK